MKFLPVFFVETTLLISLINPYPEVLEITKVWSSVPIITPWKETPDSALILPVIGSPMPRAEGKVCADIEKTFPVESKKLAI